MGVFRRYLELAIDMIMFVIACTFLMSGFLYLTKNQQAIKNVFTDKGATVVSEVFPDNTVCADEIVAFCLYPSGVESLILDGVVYDTGSLKSVVPHIDFQKRYVVTRIHTETGTCLDVMTVLP